MIFQNNFAYGCSPDTIWVFYDFSRYAAGDHFTVVQREHTVANADDDVHMVLDQQNADAAFGTGIQNETGHIPFLFLVHAGHGLVQEQ